MDTLKGKKWMCALLISKEEELLDPRKREGPGYYR
jgi:hypothetical protein